MKIQELDCQRPYKKKIFGYGFLMSRRKAAELKAKEQSIKANVFYWNLSEREQEIIEKLSNSKKGDGIHGSNNNAAS